MPPNRPAGGVGEEPTTRALPGTTPAPSATAGATDRTWLVRASVLVAVFATVTLFWSAHVGIPLRDPRGAILWTRVLLSAALFVVLSLADAAARAWRTPRGLRATPTEWRRRWTARRLGMTAAALAAYHLVYFCYHNLKSWDVFNPPRDGMLLAWDRWLFLGHSPAVLLHDLLGQHVAAYVLLVVYESFSTLVSVSFVAALVFRERLRDGLDFIGSMLWVWILGLASYYLIPSLGPFHAAPAEFSGLPHTMIQDTQARYMAQRADLLAHPQAHDAFAQVSAFASLHVAVTTVILLMARHYGLRRTSRVLTVFLLGTIVATIYLGWHFAVDDVAGLIIAWVSVTLGRLMTRRRRGRQLRPVP